MVFVSISPFKFVNYIAKFKYETQIITPQKSLSEEKFSLLLHTYSIIMRTDAFIILLSSSWIPTRGDPVINHMYHIIL